MPDFAKLIFEEVVNTKAVEDFVMDVSFKRSSRNIGQK